jgi:TolB-like protein/protein involved in temperature-dependent protein secretion
MNNQKLEERIKVLEKSFSTLSTQLDQLKLALEYIQKDPQSSLTKSRVVLESILNRIYEIEMQKEPKKFEIGYILSDNQFTRKLEYRIISRMNSIRDMANLGPHFKGEVNSTDAVRVLDDLCEVIEWYMKRYENKDLAYTAIEDVKNKFEQKIDTKSKDSDITVELPKQEKSKESIVVLPFKNMSADPEQEYFCEGIAEELINALTQIKDLWVVARTSAFSFRGKDMDIREIGRQLNVDKALEGSIRKSGQKLRITAQLINVKDGYHLWSEKYDRKLEDVFDIQDEISLAIVDKLKVTLLGEDKAKLSKRYTDDFEVYDLYLKGRYYLNTFTEEGIKRSLDYFQQAIQKNRDYALAYGGVACVYFALAIIGQFPSNETMPRAKSELLKSLELDDSLAETHAWLGDLYLVYEWDWSSAERELQRAIELKPNSPEAHQFYSDYLSMMGRQDEALAEAERARTLDPLSIIAKTILIWQFFVSHQYDRVIEHCREVLKTESNFLIQMHLWRALRRKNMLEEAWVECKKFFNLFISREIAEAMECSYAESGYEGAMRTAAEKLTEQSKQRYISPCMIATIFAHAEDDDRTLQWLEKAYEERDQYFYSIRMDPDWDRVRSNPRFKALLKKIGLEK